MLANRSRPAAPILTGIAACALVALLGACALLCGVTLTHGNLSSVAFGGLLTLAAVGTGLGFIAWLLGLMRAAHARQWDWLIAVLLLGPAGALIYSFTSGGSQRELAAPQV